MPDVNPNAHPLLKLIAHLLANDATCTISADDTLTVACSERATDSFILVMTKSGSSLGALPLGARTATRLVHERVNDISMTWLVASNHAAKAQN